MAIVAIGLVVPLAAGVFDLSVGNAVGIRTIVSVWLMANHGVPVVPAIAISIAAGCAIGLGNSFLVTKLGIDSFIATLGMSSGARGRRALDHRRRADRGRALELPEDRQQPAVRHHPCRCTTSSSWP